MDDCKTYLVSYPYQGARYSIEVAATDWADAEARIKQMCFAKVDGEVALKIPVPGGSLVHRLLRRLGIIG